MSLQDSLPTPPLLPLASAKSEMPSSVALHPQTKKARGALAPFPRQYFLHFAAALTGGHAGVPNGPHAYDVRGGRSLSPYQVVRYELPAGRRNGMTSWRGGHEVRK